MFDNCKAHTYTETQTHMHTGKYPSTFVPPTYYD